MDLEIIFDETLQVKNIPSEFRELPFFIKRHGCFSICDLLLNPMEENVVLLVEAFDLIQMF